MQDPVAAILQERQFLEPAECQEFLHAAEHEGCYIEEVLIRERKFSRKDLLRILENHYFCPSIDLESVPYAPALLSQIPRRLSERHLAFPVCLKGEAMEVAFANPGNDTSREAIALTIHRQISSLVALRHDLRDTIKQRYDQFEREMVEAQKTDDKQATAGTIDEAPSRAGEKFARIHFSSVGNEDDSVMALVDEIIAKAAKLEATDIHIEPQEKELILRYRLDGILHIVASFPMALAPPIASRIKIMGGMDITEHRLPQDGRHTLRRGEQLFDLRISSLPSQFGEKIAIRILSKSIGLLELDNLHMPLPVRQKYDEVVTSPQGFFLVTGPTGSGKTTTLYATLATLDRESINILTLEDPIEYSIPGITQVQVMPRIGLDFASGLHSFLRQDPDVILVGEIRDLETVEIACRASLTGHKVLSTLHTNDAAQSIPRLIDMGVPPFLVAATLRGVLSQRLVRMLCEECREAHAPEKPELAILGYAKTDKIYHPRGCDKCAGTGYKGRMAIFEYLPVVDNIHKLIFERASSYAIRHAAKQNGMVQMADYGRQAVLYGLTTIAEIERSILFEEGREHLCRNCNRVVSVDFVVCPHCQSVLKEKCAGCGSPLDPSWRACPDCGLEIESELRKVYCPHCLAPVEGRLAACPYCGGAML